MTTLIPMTGITFAQMFVFLFSGIFGLMGLVFLAVGLVIYGSQNRKRAQCTAYAEGTVSAMQSQFGSGNLRAVYSFSIDGKPVQYVSNYAGMNSLLVGQTVDVYYDPARIGRVYIEQDAQQIKRFSLVFTVLGGVFLFIALFVAVILLGVL
jgi:hypothetical protein